MIRIDESTQIGRPRDEVFEFLTNVDNLPRWQSGVVQSRRMTQGAVRIGFQYEEIVKVGPWKLNAVCTVTDLKTNERFAFQMKSSGPLDCDGRFDLQPVGGGTRLTISGIARLKGLWRFMQLIFASDLRKETRTELATVKLLLEADGQAVENRALARQS